MAEIEGDITSAGGIDHGHHGGRSAGQHRWGQLQQRAQVQVAGQWQVGHAIDQQACRGRSRHCHSHWRRCRSVRHRYRQSTALQAHRVGGVADIAGGKGGRVAGGDRLDPGLEIAQRVVRQALHLGRDPALVGQHRVVQLLARPGRVAKVPKTHHPRTALEGVEGAPHGRHRAQVGGLCVQLAQRLACRVQHFAGFF